MFCVYWEYSKTCLKRPLKNNTNIGFHDQLLLNAGQKYCRMLQGEQSEFLLASIKLSFVIKICVLSIFEWPFKTGLLYINSSSSCLFQTYSMDCYFRQLWIDKRLAFNVSMPNVSLNIKMLERLWYPDTIFLNGGRSYVHMVPMPNKFFRINDDGTVLYSQRYI